MTFALIQTLTRQPYIKKERWRDLKSLLDEAYTRYHRASFIENDPISIPSLFSTKQDREIAGFLAATLAWGQRKTILKSAHRLLSCMDSRPYEFVLHASKADLKLLQTFVHRTFQGEDAVYFIQALRFIYQNYASMEDVFTEGIRPSSPNLAEGILHFREKFFTLPHALRTRKHVPDIARNAAAKRLNMFLRWMVRKDAIDFGLWKSISPAQLLCPLDVHTGRVARSLGLLERKQDDWKAVLELTESLKKLDPHDPIKYDIALFSLGVDTEKHASRLL